MYIVNTYASTQYCMGRVRIQSEPMKKSRIDVTPESDSIPGNVHAWYPRLIKHGKHFV